MILSVSRRTDIPNYYSEWFFHRIREGFLYVRNPMNVHQVSEIKLRPDLVDCIVFWTKNPEPMIRKLDELQGYQYYFQFTLTGYGADIECNIPNKREKMLSIFQRLSREVGKERVIWRYDPILFTDRYSPEYHGKAFARIAGALRGYTDKCVISFVDSYAKNKKALDSLHTYPLSMEQLLAFAGRLGRIARENGMEIGSCGEKIDLAVCGIKHNCCIDKELIEKLIGSRINARKDKNQRPACGCVESIDVGAYNTCKSWCKYCYANDSRKSVEGNWMKYDPASPLLCGKVTEGDKISQRNVRSLQEGQ